MVEFIFEYDLSIVAEPHKTAMRPHNGAIKGKPGNMNKNGNPKPHTLAIGFAICSKKIVVIKNSSARVAANNKNQKFRLVSGAFPCALNNIIHML